MEEGEIVYERVGAVVFKYSYRKPSLTPQQNRKLKHRARMRELQIEMELKNPILCWYCGEATNNIPGDSLAKEAEHMIPVSRGGPKGRKTGNVVWACHDCNQIKGDMTVEEYRAEIERMGGEAPWKFYKEEFPDKREWKRLGM